MIAAFFKWWLEQMSDLLPQWLRRTVAVEADALLLTPVDGAGDIHLQAALRRNGTEEPLGELDLGGRALGELPRAPRDATVIRLPRTELLEKTLVLPLAAQAELGQAIAFEMDRETPFATDEVYWTHWVDAFDRQHGRLTARLILIPKSKLEPLRTALADHGIEPQWIEAVDDRGGSRRIPLDGERGLPVDRERRIARPLAAACAALALLSVVIPFVLQSSALSTLDAKINAVRGRASQAEDLRRQIHQLSQSAQLVAGELAKGGRPLDLVATLTRLLPDDTYLTEMEISQGKVTLSGRSMNAARLIGLLAADARIRNPTFSAPVTRIEGTNNEVFTVGANIGPPS